jgi:hypothetical protein
MTPTHDDVFAKPFEARDFGACGESFEPVNPHRCVALGVVVDVPVRLELGFDLSELGVESL